MLTDVDLHLLRVLTYHAFLVAGKPLSMLTWRSFSLEISPNRELVMIVQKTFQIIEGSNLYASRSNEELLAKKIASMSIMRASLRKKLVDL